MPDDPQKTSGKRFRHQKPKTKPNPQPPVTKTPQSKPQPPVNPYTRLDQNQDLENYLQYQPNPKINYLANEFARDPIGTIRTLQSHHKPRRQLANYIQNLTPDHHLYSKLRYSWQRANRNIANLYQTGFDRGALKTAAKNNPDFPQLSVNEKLMVRHNHLNKFAKRSQQNLHPPPVYDHQHLQKLIHDIPNSYYNYYATQTYQERHPPAINPQTGKPYQVGEIITDPQTGKPVIDYNIPKTQDHISSQSAHVATQRLAHWLKHERVKFLPYLHGAFGECLKEALGFIGDGWKAIEKLDRKASLAGLHKSLDPDLIQRTIRQLDQKALNVILMPFSKTLGLIGRIGFTPFNVVYSASPSFNSKTNRVEHLPSSRIVFAPLFALSKGADKIADKLDIWTKKSTSPLQKHTIEEKFNHQLEAPIKIFNDAYKDKDWQALFKSSNALNRLVDSYDGFNYIRYQNRRTYEKKLNQDRNRFLARLLKQDWQTISRQQWRQLKRENKGLLGKQLRQHNRKQLGNEFGNFIRGSTRTPFRRLAKNIRRTDRDPFTYLGMLLGNLVWDFTAGAALNTFRYALSRAVNRIPGVRVARAYVTNLIHNTPAGSAARIGLTNFKHAFKAPFSLNTASSTYLGYQLGSSIFPNSTFTLHRLGMPGAYWQLPIGIPNVNMGGLVGGGLGFGLGTTYQTALLNLLEGTPLTDVSTGVAVKLPGAGAVPMQVYWHQSQIHTGPVYRRLFGLFKNKTQAVYLPQQKPGLYADLLPEEMLDIDTNLNYFERSGFKTTFGSRPLFKFKIFGKQFSFTNSPLTSLTTFLYEHPYARLPLKGFAIKSALLQYLPAEILALPVPILNVPLSTLVNYLPLIDYLWQIKNPLFADILAVIAKSPIGRFFGSRIYAPINNLMIQAMYKPYLPGVSGGFKTGWLSTRYEAFQSRLFKGLQVLKPSDAILQARPYVTILRNILNPGFFIGLSFIPLLTPTLGAAALVAGPLVGSGLWIGYHHLINSLSAKKFIPLGNFSGLGYLGSTLGGIAHLGMAIFGIPLPMSVQMWYLMWSLGVPFVLTGFGPLIKLFGGLLTRAGFAALGGALAGLGVGISSFFSSLMTSILAGTQFIFATTSILAVSLFTGYLVFNSVRSYQQGLQSDPQSACFNYKPITLTITDRQTQPPQDFGGHIDNIRLQSLDLLQDRSQYTHLDIIPDEQALFHHSFTTQPHTQLYQSKFIQFEATLSPGWLELNTTNPTQLFDQIVAFKTSLAGHSEPISIAALENNNNYLSIDLTLEGPLTLTQMINQPDKFTLELYPELTEYNQLFDLDNIAALQTQARTQQALIADLLALKNTLPITDQSLAQHQTTIPPELINSLQVTQYHQQLQNIFNQSTPTPLQRNRELDQLLSQLITSRDITEVNLSLSQSDPAPLTHQLNQIDQQLEQAKPIIDLASRLYEDLDLMATIMLNTYQLPDELYLYLNQHYPDNPQLSAELDSLPETKLYLDYLHTIYNQYLDKRDLPLLVSQFDQAQTFFLDTKDYYQQQIDSLNQSKAELEYQKTLLTQEFYYIAANTTIDIFYTLTYAGDPSQPYTITSGVSSRSGPGGTVQYCRANQTLNLNQPQP